ncbi:hypothetical protein MMC29_001336 [Sticta canariensis]|nr:hypothetical protein [Sticta canariensis]
MERQVIPPGGDNSTGPELEAVIGLFMSIAFILVNLRLYVRARILKKLWWDDFFLLLGMLFSITNFGIIVTRVNSGLGRHAYYLSPEQISLDLKLELMATLASVISNMFSKISICLLLIRIFTTKKAWKRALYVIMALIVATKVSSATLTFPRCKPAAKYWNPNINGTCWPQETQLAIFYYQSGVSIFTDFLLAFLPSFFLKDLQISLRTKLSICALMSCGVFTGVCGINRALSIQNYDPSDVTYSSKNLGLWMSLEINFAIIAAASPALRPLWAKKRINQNQEAIGQANLPNNKKGLKSPYVALYRQREADLLCSRLETRITAQGDRDNGDVGSEATSLPNCNGIMTSDVSMENLGESEGKGIPKHSGQSDREKSLDDHDGCMMALIDE